MTGGGAWGQLPPPPKQPAAAASVAASLDNPANIRRWLLPNLPHQFPLLDNFKVGLRLGWSSSPSPLSLTMEKQSIMINHCCHRYCCSHCQHSHCHCHCKNNNNLLLSLRVFPSLLKEKYIIATIVIAVIKQTMINHCQSRFHQCYYRICRQTNYPYRQSKIKEKYIILLTYVFFTATVMAASSNNGGPMKQRP